MKRCLQCRRDYYDDSLSFCLDDGAALVDGPSTGEPATAVLPRAVTASEEPTTLFDTGRTAMPIDRRSLVAALGLLVIAALAIGGYFYFTRPSHQIESIAVLPFTNVDGNQDLEYLSDGLTESLINSLSQVPSLSVKARSSVFTYKGKEVTPQQVARDLSVQAVLNGRVTRRDDQVLLNIELVDTKTGDQIWGDQYKRKIADLIQLQSDIAKDVSSRLKERLSGVDQQKVARNYTQNIEAYQLYLRGRYYWNKRTPNDIRRSIEFFQQAIDKDPTYALAYAGLAEGFILIPGYREGSPQEYYPKARAAAMKAIEIDASLAEAHNALAAVMSNYDWKFADAEAEWRKAIELNSNYASAHQWYAEHLKNMGRNGEALTEMKTAQELDPLSLIINGLLSAMYRANGQNDEALEQLNKTLEIDPNFPRTHLFLAETYQVMGRYDDAADEFAKTFLLSGGPPDKVAQFTTTLKNAYKSGGLKAFSRTMSDLLENTPELGGRAPVTVVAGYLADAGETDKAFEVLEQAYQRHDDTITMIKDSRLDRIKSDPRYLDLIRKVGLPE